MIPRVLNDSISDLWRCFFFVLGTAEDGSSGGMPSFQSHKEVDATSPKKEKNRLSLNLLMVTDHLTSAFNSALKNANTEGRVSSTHSAKKLAKKLFEGLDEDQGGVITRNEFEPYFKTASDAAMAFNLFDKDGNGDIDRKEMRNAVVRIYRERRALAIGLKVCIHEKPLHLIIS